MCIRRKESLRWTGELVCVWRVELSEPARVFVVTVRGTVEPILSPLKLKLEVSQVRKLDHLLSDQQTVCTSLVLYSLQY